MLLRKNHRHTGMDLCDEFIGFACDNRAGAQPLPRFGIFPVFPEPGKGRRPAVFHGEERTVVSVWPCYAVRRNQESENRA